LNKNYINNQLNGNKYSGIDHRIKMLIKLGLAKLNYIHQKYVIKSDHNCHFFNSTSMAVEVHNHHSTYELLAAGSGPSIV